MSDSAGTLRNLRIRFAGLCLFVPEPKTKRVHVLLPPTTIRNAEGEHPHVASAHLMDAHSARIHWRTDGGFDWSPLGAKPLELPEFTNQPADLVLKDLFDLKQVKPKKSCTAGTPGTVDLDTAPAIGRMVLRSGSSKVINRGGKWKIPGIKGKVQLPTVMDWTVENIPEEILWKLLDGWGVFKRKRPDITGNTVNLWILHVPGDEHKPLMINETVRPANGPAHHFTAYYKLLSCGEYDAVPDAPEVKLSSTRGDTREGVGKDEIEGMLINCMLAKADLA